MTGKAEKLYNKISSDLLGEVKFGSRKQSAGGRLEKPTWDKELEGSYEGIKKFEDYLNKKGTK